MGQFNPAPIQDFIGKGLSFPIKLTGGSSTLTSGTELIKSSIASILSFSLGQRFFLGEYGTRIEELIEEPNEVLLENVLENFITKALREWEKRIEVLSVTTEPIGATGINIDINYLILNTQVEDNFIWPFYNELLT